MLARGNESSATLNETFTAIKYDGALPRTPWVRPKSKIYTPKRDDEHHHRFDMRIPPPSLPPPPREPSVLRVGQTEVNGIMRATQPVFPN